MARPRKDGTAPLEPNRKKIGATDLRAHPGKAARNIWDTHQRNLVLRVQPTGHKAWFAVYRFHSRPRWYFIGDAGSIGLADARHMAAEIAVKVMRGEDPAADRRAERGAGTFAELHEKYLEQYARRRNKSWKQADALVRRHALPRWGKLQAASISRADIKAMMRRIEAPIVANQTLAAVSAVFTWGVREEIVPTNPCKLVDRNPVRSRERVLADSEIAAFWSAFTDAGPVIGAALKVILLTGQRPGEVAHMRREHIIDGWWQMPGEPVEAIGWPGTKNGESHRVWLAEPVRALIGAGANGFAFAGKRGKPIGQLDADMRAICSKIGAERATPHDLRRTAGSTITGLGFGRQAMDRILNHADHSTGSIYDRHGYGTEDRHIMESLAAKIIGLAEGRDASNVVDIHGRSAG